MRRKNQLRTGIRGFGEGQVPKFTVISDTTRKVTVHTAELKAALDMAHMENISVPEIWNNVVITLYESAGVAADYGTFYFAQRLPLTVDAPAGFPLDEFYEILFRMIGINTADARHLRDKFAINPADFLLVGPQYHLVVREVQLVGRPGLLVQDSNNKMMPGLIWGSSDRAYFLWGTISEGEMINIANSMQ